MLELINDARRNAGLGAVSIGSNSAAQEHAEAMVAGCFMSHWGADGLKPYMRYSLLDGHQSNAENVYGSRWWYEGNDPCALSASSPPDLDRLVREAMDGWLSSAGHRRTLLDPHHRQVNLGLAWRSDGEQYLFRAVQHFEGDYTTLDALPTIVDGVIRFAGSTRNDATLNESPTVYIRYDPPPRPASREHLNETRSYCGGEPVAAIFASPYRYAEMSGPVCVGPGEEPFARAAVMIRVPTVVARVWKVGEASFEIQADLSEVLDQHGPGVYSFTIRGRVGGDPRATLLEYAVFHDVFLQRTAAEYVRANGLLGVFIWHPARQSWTMYAERGGRPVPGSTNSLIGEGAVVVPIND